MNLSNREIRLAVERGLIGLTPLPADSHRWSPAAVDLCLGEEINPWEEIEGEEGIIDPSLPTFNVTTLVEKYTKTVDCTHGFIIGPHRLVLGWTIERIKIRHTSRIAARVEGKSSLARIGLGIHVT